MPAINSKCSLSLILFILVFEFAQNHFYTLASCFQQTYVSPLSMLTEPIDAENFS
jgi:hypothetical protein